MERHVTRRYKKASRAPIFILLAMTFILIGIIALLFSLFVMDDLKKDPNEFQLARLKTTAELFPGQVFLGEMAESAADSRYEEQASITLPGDPSDLKTEHVLVQTVVPETAPVEDDYFSDAVFIGDSISLGLKTNIRQITSGISPNQFIAEKSISILSVVNNQAVFDNKSKTLWQAMAAQVPNPAKIYVLLGTNGLPWYSNDEQIQMYDKLIDQLREKYPNTLLYVESLTPKRKVSDYDKKFDSAKINDFNDKLLALAEEKGVYYLNVQEVMKDTEGYLKAEYSTDEGLHPVAAGHKAMLGYYRSHAVQPDGYVDAVVKD